jgi:hypothetical protein
VGSVAHRSSGYPLPSRVGSWRANRRSNSVWRSVGTGALDMADPLDMAVYWHSTVEGYFGRAPADAPAGWSAASRAFPPVPATPRRLGVEPVAHPVHHAGDLSLSRPAAELDFTAPRLPPGSRLAAAPVVLWGASPASARESGIAFRLRQRAKVALHHAGPRPGDRARGRGRRP